jgi:threonine synthase
MSSSTTQTTLPLIERYRDFLPVTDQTPIISLGEGSTPLVEAPRLAAALGVGELWLKFEGMNPTGSFKDRGMVMAIAKALEAGARSVVCASTGNTSASAAAYAAPSSNGRWPDRAWAFSSAPLAA